MRTIAWLLGVLAFASLASAIHYTQNEVVGDVEKIGTGAVTYMNVNFTAEAGVPHLILFYAEGIMANTTSQIRVNFTENSTGTMSNVVVVQERPAVATHTNSFMYPYVINLSSTLLVTAQISFDAAAAGMNATLKKGRIVVLGLNDTQVIWSYNAAAADGMGQNGLPRTTLVKPAGESGTYLILGSTIADSDSTSASIYGRVLSQQVQAPYLSAHGASNFNDATTTETTPSLSWAAGDLVVVVGATDTDTITLTTPSASGLTFNTIMTTAGTSNARTYAWFATAASAGSGTISSTVSFNDMAGIYAWVFKNATIGHNSSMAGSTAKTVVHGSMGKNSSVVQILADWAAVNDLTVAATPTGNVRTANWTSGNAAYFVLDWIDRGLPVRTSYGLTSHTGTVDMSGITVEIVSNYTIESIPYLTSESAVSWARQEDRNAAEERTWEFASVRTFDTNERSVGYFLAETGTAADTQYTSLVMVRLDPYIYFANTSTTQVTTTSTTPVTLSNLTINNQSGSYLILSSGAFRMDSTSIVRNTELTTNNVVEAYRSFRPQDTLDYIPNVAFDYINDSDGSFQVIQRHYRTGASGNAAAKNYESLVLYLDPVSAGEPPSDSCTYGGSGDWTIIHDCTITSVNNLPSNKVYFQCPTRVIITGSGRINALLRRASGGCKVTYQGLT